MIKKYRIINYKKGDNMNSHFVGNDFRVDLDRRKAEQRAFRGNSQSDFARYPLLYIGLLISGGLSALSGIFIGLAPHYVDGVLVVNLDFVNVMFAILYAVTFPMLGEYAIAEWHKKYSLRDMDDVSDDKRQAIIALIMLLVSVAFTLITSLAASVILISLLGSFDVFRHIPAWAQTWTAIVIPIGAVLHSVATIAYKHNSREEENLRLLRRQRMDAETKARLIIEQARTDAEIEVNVHRARLYADMAKQRAPEFGKSLAEREIQRHFGGAGNYPAPQSPRQAMAYDTVGLPSNPTGKPERED